LQRLERQTDLRRELGMRLLCRRRFGFERPGVDEGEKIVAPP
jgi:hypothetical protein